LAIRYWLFADRYSSPGWQPQKANDEQRTTNDYRPTTPYNVIIPWPHQIQFATKPKPLAAGRF
jgi:hypothetical protein